MTTAPPPRARIDAFARTCLLFGFWPPPPHPDALAYTWEQDQRLTCLERASRWSFAQAWAEAEARTLYTAERIGAGLVTLTSKENR